MDQAKYIQGLPDRVKYLGHIPLSSGLKDQKHYIT